MKLFFSLWLLSIIVVLPGNAQTAFTKGNIIVFRAGDSITALTNAAVAAFLDEYTPAGLFVQTIALPTTASGFNKIVTTAGSAVNDGMITRSVNGQYLIVPGYNAPVGTATVATTASTAVNRVVARVDAAGAINSITALTDAYSGGNFTSVTSSDGANFFAVGSNSGVRSFGLGGTTSVLISGTTTNIRAINNFNNQLYISTTSGLNRLATVGSGGAVTNLAGFPIMGSPNQFFFADVDPSTPGIDVLYVADDGIAVGIQKFSLVNGNWLSNGNMVPAAAGTRGLTGVVTGTSVTLYTSTPSNLYSITDASGYNATMTGTFTPLAKAPANTAFRGVALAPLTNLLPLTVTSFNGSFSNNYTVFLNWTVVSDVDVKSYIVERSSNGRVFFAIGDAAANKSQSSYSFTDISPLRGINYYVLKFQMSMAS